MKAYIVLLLAFAPYLCDAGVTIHRDVQDIRKHGLFERCGPHSWRGLRYCTCNKEFNTMMSNHDSRYYCKSPFEIHCYLSLVKKSSTHLVETGTSAEQIHPDLPRKVPLRKVYVWNLIGDIGKWYDITEAAYGYFKVKSTRRDSKPLLSMEGLDMKVWKGQLIKIEFGVRHYHKCLTLKVKGAITYPILLDAFKDQIRKPRTTKIPTTVPTVPTTVPTTKKPTTVPTVPTTKKPTTVPTVPTTKEPTTVPTVPTTKKPTTVPTVPTTVPTTKKPTTVPTVPTTVPTTKKPTTVPTVPTTVPTSKKPTTVPTVPTTVPTTKNPTTVPTAPTTVPTTKKPTTIPTVPTTKKPTTVPIKPTTEKGTEPPTEKPMTIIPTTPAKTKPKSANEQPAEDDETLINETLLEYEDGMFIEFQDEMLVD